ncbi:MAG TPA: SurA N-terminal domain-containing protein [Armatimonadaceae bacterium]|nr:SurA N-terminal domain-containing protein [Armatimonadaceae bacterium]
MKGTTSVPARRALLACSAAIVGASLLSGCGSNDVFAKVNNQVITKDEYIKALERQSVTVPGGQPTNAERLVLDQLVGNRILLAEASKNEVLPKDEDINRLFETQKKIVEQQLPGKKYEDILKEQGATPEEVKNDLRVQLAETNLYAKLLKLDEAEVKQAFDAAKERYSLPARVQLRLIVADTPAKAKDVEKQLKEMKKFADIATAVNPQPLKADGGLIRQTTPTATLPAPWQTKAQQTAKGKHFGPVEFPGQPGTKAWVMIEEKLPAFSIPFEDAAPLVRRELVQMKVMDPANAGVRNQIIKQKMDASFDATDDSYEAVWTSVKEQAQKAGIGGAGAGAPTAAGAPPIAPPAAGGAPAVAPAPK